MNRLFVLAVALSVTIVGLCARADDKEIKVKDVMKAHKEGGQREKVITAIRAKKWDVAAKPAKEWEMLAEALTKIKCPKGDAEDWKKQTATFAKTVKTLNEAIAKKDAKSAAGALGFIGTRCKKCHDAHK
jgi:hypothetical protein